MCQILLRSDGRVEKRGVQTDKGTLQLYIVDYILVDYIPVDYILLQPESHFFLGNLLAAKHNLSGAVDHFELALRQSAIHKDAFSMLRVTRCYQKFHESAQSQAPDTNAKAKQPCVNKRPADSHVICKQVGDYKTIRSRATYLKCGM